MGFPSTRGITDPQNPKGGAPLIGTRTSGPGTRGRPSLEGASTALVLIALTSCASRVDPPLPEAPPLRPIAGLEILLVSVPEEAPLRNEVAALLGGLGVVEQEAESGAPPLRTYCGQAHRLVARPQTEKFGFASNASERNSLFIYESAIVVGLPVTLIAAYAWPWYGEVIAEGQLETLWCGTGSAVARTGVLTLVRADGTGIIAQDTLEREMEPLARAALARDLVSSAARRGCFEEGGSGCTDSRP